ncbi:MAG: hypothetical protein ACXAEL_06315 [Candidatus Hodarchaeales archaeon]
MSEKNPLLERRVRAIEEKLGRLMAQISREPHIIWSDNQLIVWSDGSTTEEPNDTAPSHYDALDFAKLTITAKKFILSSIKRANPNHGSG